MGGFGSALGLLFEINADPDNAVVAMELFQEKFASSLGVTNKEFAQFKDAAGAAAKDLAVIGGLVGGAAAGMLALAEHAAEAGNAIYGAAQKTGMSAEALSGIMAISKETGKSFDGLIDSFARATRNLAEAADTGKGALTELFSAAQLQALKLKPVDEEMHVVLQRIFAITNAGERNRELQALLGRGWMENVGILKRLASEGYAPAVQMAKEFGVFFDAKAANDAHTFMKEMDTLKAEFSGIAITLGRELIPFISEYIASIHGLGDELKGLGEKYVALQIAVLDPYHAWQLWKAGTVAQTKAIQEQTDWLTKLQGSMKAAADSAKEMGGMGGLLSGGGATGAGGKDNFLIFGPKQIKDVQVAIDGMDHVLLNSVEVVSTWEHALEGPLAVLPLLQKNVELVTFAEQAGAKAKHESAEAQIKSAASLLNDLGLKREYAAFMAVYEAAEGYKALGNHDFWGAAQDFISAEQFAVAAGTSSRKASGGGGGGASGGSSSGYSGAPGGGGGGGAASAGSGTTVHLHVYNPSFWDQSTMNQFFAQANSLVKGGQLVISATNALYNGEKLG